MKLKKGSPEAKRYMAKIRAMKSGTKKKSIGATKMVEKKYKETKSTKPKRTIQITRRGDGTFKKFKQIGATKFVEKNETSRTKPKKNIQITRRSDGTFKKFKAISGLHKDTKSHNVRISVMSGIKDDTLKDLYYKSNYNQKLIEILNNLKIELKNKHNSNLIKTNLKKDIMQVKKNILSNKNAISNLKKLI